jgi:oxygen-independent coproporphyrinogen-3 oxidase
VHRRAGIYIHIPFCERKCTYCNFNTTDYFEDLAGRYITAASREILYWGERLSGQTDSLLAADTIFFGGGTPSIVEAGQLGELVQSCRTAFDMATDAEVTIEINPGSFVREKIERWLKGGINRASVGVQSFLDHELQSLSRTHTAYEARCTFDLLREAGFNNISLDLIAGLPGQSLADWELNLRSALSLQPEHLSLYLLEVKEGTQLFSQIKRSQRPEPDDDLAAEMYRMICDMTLAAGYDQYEISNFARKVDGAATPISPFRSKHNLKYWTGAPFYGIGCGAHSYDGFARWVNVFKAETYIDRILEGQNAIADRNELNNSDRAAEALFMGLRLTEGINLSEFRVEHGVDVIERYGHDLPRLEDAGLIEMIGGRLALTAAGRLLSNEVFVSFV